LYIKKEIRVSGVTNRTWAPYSPAPHGRLSKVDKDSLPKTAFAFPRTRKEPMTDAAHVRDAMARFNQVEGVTDSERDQAFSNIQQAAHHFAIKMKESDWHEFGSQRPKTPAHLE
jgi:hypothetical protein